MVIQVTVVWENFIVGNFDVKIVRGKKFSPLWAADKKFLTVNFCSVKFYYQVL